ncbi:Glucose-1-phosphate cytidylyltransferase [Indibacter alkaliphilus LW1]|uniref:Glucose-1-phosphate cytidylyltransferase n=1 Tax=Indibacter alkaliphilus (strain CCUG 57479 / KCTC 22604 / LW1) TaxID=1189612 RepID=S2DGW7_INDAL|nr:glucose-1-phosphate cytidylyltransferase [Indibacter alkaliphilus]EOZ96365.1 Glucose-1-phosphate cytidylyltransferase [Indibacter alkaliphilus LW1]
MKAVILAGGFGTRISEESGIRPKPMVEIGGKPILWHIMKIYSKYGINEFIICCGYKGYMIKEYFSNYFLYMSDMTFDLEKNEIQVHCKKSEPWKVTLVDTGENVMTGGRIKRVSQFIKNETFCLTYGDGVSDVNIKKLIDFHFQNQSTVTLTAVRQPGRFGAFSLKNDQHKITQFREKPFGDGNDNAWINGGFFVVEPEALNLINGDETVWEKEPLEEVANKGNLSAFKHTGFWQPMDTLRDKNYLEDLWQSGDAPWKIW